MHSLKNTPLRSSTASNRTILGYSVLATPLLMSPVLYFLEMPGFEKKSRELPQQAGALPT
jgi:hypothetical protein